MRLVAAISILALYPVLPVQAADNVAVGRAIAETWCQPCHASGTRQTSDVAKPLSEIATTRTRQSIAAFLADPHGEMPNIQLARQQIADVTAYMQTLKSK